ncbi:MAG: hypothetical protein VXX73_05810, partial [Pseudomonadota bacterium]|nr:hypothetical protein [Pseudomonadota bacterium]
KTNCVVNSDGHLTILGSLLIDDTSITSFDAITSLDGLGAVLPEAEYEFSDTLDLGGIFSLDLARRFVTRAFFPDANIDTRAEKIKKWPDFDGDGVDSVDAQLYMKKTNDDPSSSNPSYTPWRKFVSGTFKGRGFKFKAELTSEDVAQNIKIIELGYKATFKRRQENSNGVIFSTTNGEEGGTAGTCPITFEKPFFVGTADLGGANAYLPSIGVTVQNLGNGERVNVSNVTSTGFSVDVLNSSGSNVTRKFSYTAVGYGRQV